MALDSAYFTKSQGILVANKSKSAVAYSGAFLIFQQTKFGSGSRTLMSFVFTIITSTIPLLVPSLLAGLVLLFINIHSVSISGLDITICWELLGLWIPIHLQ